MIVGLTGGIGSGKTFVAELFSDLGIPIYISDLEAKNLMNTNEMVIVAISTLFGNEAYINGILNRAYIAKKVFTNKEILQKLNAIVHPAVARHFKEWYALQKADYVIKESAILFEIGGHVTCDATILVTAPLETRIKRVLKRDRTTAEAIKERINNQWLDEQKIPLATYLIENIEKETTRQRVVQIHNKLLKTINSR